MSPLPAATPFSCEILALTDSVELPVIRAAAQLFHESLIGHLLNNIKVAWQGATRSDFLVPEAPALPEELVRVGAMPTHALTRRSFFAQPQGRVAILSLWPDVFHATLIHRTKHYHWSPDPSWHAQWSPDQRRWVAEQFMEGPPLSVEVAGRMWRTIVADLQDRGSAGVFLCNVFRQPPASVAYPHLGAAEAVRERIRRFNLMAIEVSHATGAYLVDIDRALADGGAASLQTDCRLSGGLAAVVAAEVLVSTLLQAGLDEVCPAEVQEAATAHVGQRRAVRNWLAARPAHVALLGEVAKFPPVAAESPITESEAQARAAFFASGLDRSKRGYLVDHPNIHRSFLAGLREMAEGYTNFAAALARKDGPGQNAGRQRIAAGTHTLSPFRKAFDELSLQ